jgi:cell division transport system permease protein
MAFLAKSLNVNKWLHKSFSHIYYNTNYSLLLLLLHFYWRMKQNKNSKLKKRFLNSWITSLISISLVLVLLGLLSFILINARQLSDYVREQMGFTLVLQDDLKDVEIIRLEKVLNASDFVKSTRFIDKEDAAKELSTELGEDFTDFLGYNPLFASIDVKLYAPYTATDSLIKLEQTLLAYPQVAEVYYQKDLVFLINKNIRKISLVLLVISGLLTVVFFGLINNTIRILIYAQRFSINTMQMVGASNSFIRLPFIWRSLLLGTYGATIASILLVLGMYNYKKEMYGFIDTGDITTTALVIAIVFLHGLLISFLSTWLAINKFLRLKFDELFY